ncbi:MAG TPA: hypothetical protein VGC55_19295 [Dokdonella sp.]
MREATRPMPAADARRWLPWLIALAGFAFDIAAYWPGQMSFDSAYAWWQARNGTTLGIVPPAFVLVWRACTMFTAGPAPMFVLHLLLFWSGLTLFVRALRFAPARAVMVMLIVAFTPVPWLLRGHVWTDVGVLSALACASGVLATAQASGRRAWLLPALPLLLYAAALRHNALPAVLPFALWFAWLAGRRGNACEWRRSALAAIGVVASAVLLTQALNTTVRERVPAWPMLAQFDLAAMSIDTQQMLLPAFIVGPGLDVPDLAQAFREWSNLPLLVNTRHGLHAPFEPFSDDDLALLRHTWLNSIAAHPRAWLAHRWRLTRALFGAHAADWPRELLYVDDEVVYRDNPPVARNTGVLHVTLMSAAAAVAATTVLAPWPYLLLGLVSLPAAWRRRRSPAGAIALVLLASGSLYALSFTLLAVSAELRYLGWPCVACLLAAACAWLAPSGAAR